MADQTQESQSSISPNYDSPTVSNRALSMSNPKAFGSEGLGHAYSLPTSLPFSAEKEHILSFLDANSSHDLAGFLVDSAFHLLEPLQSTLGLVPRPFSVGRDYCFQLHPDILSGKRMVPGVGDRLWSRGYLVQAKGAYLRAEFEFRVVSTWDNLQRKEVDLVPGGRVNWGSGQDRRPGFPLAAGWLGSMCVVRDPVTRKLSVAPTSVIPAAEWIRDGVVHNSIVAADGPAYQWIFSADNFQVDQVNASGPWKPLAKFQWKSRRVDNDSLLHTTASRRPLPFFETTYSQLPNYRVGGIFYDMKTEILPLADCTVSGIYKEDEARFLLDDGKGTGKFNRAAVRLVPKERFKLKIDNGGPA